MTRSISPDILPICESGTSTSELDAPSPKTLAQNRRSSTRRVAFNTNYGERVFGDYTTGLIRQSHQENASIGERDIIIAVVGPTGSGKSTFVDRAVGLPDTSVGHQLSSCTREVRAVRYSNGARNIVLVDTPGFRHDSLSNAQVLQGTVDWMKNYNSDTKFDGLLYLHRISDNRWWIGAPLDQLGKLCEGEFKNIAFVTTMWDEVPEDVGLRREEELQNTFWQRMVKLGSTTHRFTGSEGSAWEIIRAISERISSRKTSAGEAVLDSYTSSSLVPKRSFRRNDKHPNSKKDQINRAAQRHTLQMIPSSAGVTMLDVAIDGSIWTGCTRTIRSGICSERGYGGALTGAITTLKLARSVAEFLQIACLQDAIVPSLSIALSIEATAGTHHALFQVVGTAGILIGVISDHAQKSRLTPEMMTAISVFAK
ncbi:hypothetical protein SCLCIDRAFT_212451 [Scleroderma citrinum Foug A]|uniref:G domain-containing protein n=1 Tax=Scleroderma citrinum Foug A TaxID=1036808 RepID=A0A0C3DKY3_9AGAM|nr:hypothetical protein SCLCIDRAFT_212451 [Scleroderma citrinum Foug A]